MHKLKILDLFSGIGGFSLGLEKSNFETIAFCEKDKHCQKVLKKHWPNIPIYSDVTPLKGSSFEEVDIICGGFPCQDISIGGKQKGIKENTRSGLWKEFKRLINEIKPKYAIIENVENLRKNGLNIVLQDLAEIGYDAEWRTVSAREVGYPHQRKRLFIIAYPSGQRFYRRPVKDGHLQVNKNGKDSKIYKTRPQCQSELGEICQIFSGREFEIIRDSYSSEFSTMSQLRRVTNGVSSKLDESRRKQRIKQLGNAVVPRILEILGKLIYKNYSKYQDRS